MSQTLLEMAKELVLAQIQSQQLNPENMTSTLNSTYQTLQNLHAMESGGNGHHNGHAEGMADQKPVNWKGSISKHVIRCLECGESFKQLSLRHLRVHDLDPRSYRVKYHIPRTQALSAREVTARRRELAQEIRPWELAPSKKSAATKNGAKLKAKPAAAKSTTPRARTKKAAAKS